MPPIRVGLIGAGGVAELHSPAVQSIGGSITAVADIDETTRENFADKFDVDHTYDSYERMIEDAPIDIVLVGVPNSLHAECAIAALEADLNVVIEKPLAHTLADAQRIAEAASSSDGQAFVGFVRAFEPWVSEVRERVADGTFGEVYDVDAEFSSQRNIPKLGGWFTQKEISGGGCMIDIGVHILHLILTILDFPEIETVSASTGDHFGSKEDYTYLSMWGGEPAEDPVFDVDDSARVFMRTVDGTTIHIRIAWAINQPSRRSIRINGDEAGASIEPEEGGRQLRIYSTERGRLTDTAYQLPDGNRFTLQWKAISATLEGERELEHNSIEEGLITQQILDAIYTSAEENKEVALTESKD